MIELILLVIEVVSFFLKLFLDTTVESLIKDTPNKGHSTMDKTKFPNFIPPYQYNAIGISRTVSIQWTNHLNLYWSQSVLYSETPLYSEMLVGFSCVFKMDCENFSSGN